MGRPTGDGLTGYYRSKVEELELLVRDKTNNLRRLEAQRNELNTQVRLLREELFALQEPGSYVGEVIKVMGKNKVLIKVHPEGKYVVDIDKDIDISKLTPGARVALRNDSYTLHLVLPTKARRLATPFLFSLSPQPACLFFTWDVVYVVYMITRAPRDCCDHPGTFFASGASALCVSLQVGDMDSTQLMFFLYCVA